MRTLQDDTLRFLREGYTFISARCDELETDLFTTRLGLRRVTCVRGAEAARMFYDGGDITRAGAVPSTTQHLLQDVGSVQGLEGEAHRTRKALFLSVLGPDQQARLAEILGREWNRSWQRAGESVVRLEDVMARILTRTACSWAGVPSGMVDAPVLTDQLRSMVDHAGSFGPAGWAARVRRRSAEAWAESVIEHHRALGPVPDEHTALGGLLRHRDADGSALSARVAAVELLNVLRPLVAVTRFVLFAQVALARAPQWRERIAEGPSEDVVGFAQEVRRFFPFFPAVPGRVSSPFRWEGHDFLAGERVVLDLYGTDHDARIWDSPESFRPERFRDWEWERHPYSLVPQGAGDVRTGHRCPGEWATLTVLRETVRRLSRENFDLPAQDLTIPLDRMPTRPRSGVLVRRRENGAGYAADGR
ncbi:cytochrome P450 [Brachybacterium endophyticum]|uniref:Cytochrome P450 n=1 Tax=Brachybacterium endophyticum TaxID=2182385 RepID=A0A2U2RHE2_9MICO|nr:cytochrome P450 [Brachybacterium endophyticum]PWH05268.1 cytochrome P450 [Brachybacterium endophyticum]